MRNELRAFTRDDLTTAQVGHDERKTHYFLYTLVDQQNPVSAVKQI